MAAPAALSAAVCIVTGAARGIGFAVSRRLLAEGSRVVLADWNLAALQQAQAQLSSEAASPSFAERLLVVQTDISSEDSVVGLVRGAVERFGRVDVLVNNAGLSEFGDLFADDAVQKWDRVLGVNLRGTFLCSRYCAMEMKKQGSGGAIINIASTRAFMSEPDTPAYSASKGGVVALTHSLAQSLGKHKIRVNCISPGWINTSQAPEELTPENHQQHPVGRVGEPDDIASAVVFFASSASAFVTGSNLIVDGGMTTKMIYV
eukprot:gnl/Hemi2/5994_TR2082_c0_g1_i1.p2 gnl/Hemi2/5994_TR2082_c0_g1~~gnl/Hemi2/5994_TR2082_c0_g1_i1.p2  ORF type:complete len:284 (+),score=106.27 gnl/Hemi2/5994_TR2082_c0_g1_i1:70-852(+)